MQKKNKYASTMNGSGLPVERIITTIVENHQTKDGHIKIPKVLHKYLDFKII
jgi:seryl-tRNA synthetase